VNPTPPRTNVWSRLLFPLLTIAFGGLCIIGKRYTHSVVGPVVEGPLVVFVGLVFCVFGLAGLVATLLELKKDRGRPASRESDLGSDV